MAPEEKATKRAQISKEELYSVDFAWTIVNERVYAIGDFIPRHPGGPLICRAIGEDSTELFHTHHTSRRALAVLASFEVAELISPSRQGKNDCKGRPRPLQELLNWRIGSLAKTPARPVAEIVAGSMLVLFAVWVYFAYVAGWQTLNIAVAWFWWRHLDAGLHATVHGDFRYSDCGHRCFLWNQPGADPDWASMNTEAWVRRHSSAPWRTFHSRQCRYWLLVTATLEPALELFNRTIACLSAVGVLLEPPTEASSLRRRLGDASLTLVEVLLSPGYQGLAFLCQPRWQALITLLLARAVTRLVLFPFSEVQHYMPEHMVGAAADVSPPASSADEEENDEEEWVVSQLRTTANLRLGSPVARWIDFLMFHGDSRQIEHHLWPAMSFVHYEAAANIVRATCAEFGLPYHECGYWEGYAKIWSQVKRHSQPPQQLAAAAEASPELPQGCNLTELKSRKRALPETAASGAKRRRGRRGCEGTPQ
eukprot:gnl/TRDRNA2_/TRDRNA2_172694_c0_seq1.p1 gnl/TRDRNA2_/TRDRNA2_172694_c0~~gnl/TRDRNA2_/TRDRNA2_172694_c0_seq1.p1  ORF type:complete len:480 (-),score=60.68 gnl/TRDRNA2_/TRDRNA2_172694_c0_seq1:213-1652(-)